MSKFTINATPFTVYTPSDGGVPGEGLNASERALFRSEMEVPSITELGDVEDKADAAQLTATSAIADAAAAQATADAACPDSEAIKTTGNQSKNGILTFNEFPQVYYPSAKEYSSNEFVRHLDILTMMGGVKTKIVNIGDWNMNGSVDGDFSTVVVHGLVDYTKIRSVDVTIRHDSGYLISFIGEEAGNAGGSWTITGNTNINLTTNTGGKFDTTNYNSTSFNRGFVIIRYLE